MCAIPCEDCLLPGGLSLSKSRSFESDPRFVPDVGASVSLCQVFACIFESSSDQEVGSSRSDSKDEAEPAEPVDAGPSIPSPSVAPSNAGPVVRVVSFMCPLKELASSWCLYAGRGAPETGSHLRSEPSSL